MARSFCSGGCQSMSKKGANELSCPRFQDVPPPSARPLGDRHVVRDDVEDVTHAELVQAVAQAGMTLLPSQLQIDLRVVDDVISVRAAGARLQIGRAIEVADAEILQIAEG